MAAAVLQNKHAFAIAKRAAALNADHPHLPARWSRLDALDLSASQFGQRNAFRMDGP
jgi:hypothetical protein